MSITEIYKMYPIVLITLFVYNLRYIAMSCLLKFTKYSIVLFNLSYNIVNICIAFRNLELFCFLDSDKKIDQLSNLVECIEKLRKEKVLCQDIIQPNVEWLHIFLLVYRLEGGGSE